MASQEYKDRIQKAVEDLPDDKAAKVAKFAERLCGRQAGPRRRRVRLGTYRGKIRIDPSFFDPLPDDMLDAFEGREIPEKSPGGKPL
jgi:hypothetical protein